MLARKSRPSPGQSAIAAVPEETQKVAVVRSPQPPRTETPSSVNRRILRGYVYDQIDPLKAAAMERDKLLIQIRTLIRRICDEKRLQLSRSEEEQVATELLDEMVGIGPIQPLLQDDTVNDILVNGSGQIFVERFGKLELTPITFLDEEHVLVPA